MNSADPNPYAPPQVESFRETPPPSMETLDKIGPIRFAGAVDEQHLREFLCAAGHVGCGHMIVFSMGLGLILLVLGLMGAGFASIAIGAMGCVVVAMTVSTIPYRRLVFQNVNPHWNRPTRGELRRDGIHLERGNTRAFFRWDWYGGVVVTDQLVAFVPATQMAQPLLVAQSMLSSLDAWSRLREVAAAVGMLSDDVSIDDRQSQQNLRILRERDRPRSIEVPEDAVAFEGFLTVADFSRIPSRYRRRQRPVRTYVVIAALISFVGLIVTGISQIVFQQMAMLPTIAAVYIMVAIAFAKMRRRKNSGDAVYFLNAFATESSIVTDFAITTTEVPWSDLRPALRTDDFASMRRRDWVQFIVTRRDMFASDEAWRRFNEMLDHADRQT